MLFKIRRFPVLIRVFLPLFLFFSYSPVLFLPPILADETPPADSGKISKEETLDFLALQEDLKKRYRLAYLSANKPPAKEERRQRVKNGWDLFSKHCRFCHGYSEKPGERAEEFPTPALNDDGRLAKTPAELFRRIYFGGTQMPPFGMGSYNGEIVAAPEGYIVRHGSRRLTPEETLDIASYLQYCYQIPGSVKWKGTDGTVVLDLSDLK